MRSTQALDSFRDFCREAGVASVDQLGATQQINFVVAWYRETQPVTDLRSSGSDTLLFQYGTYQWNDEPEWFEYDITRQFYGVPRYGIRQWRLTLNFEPTDENARLGSADRWCNNPDDIDSFLAFIEASDATRWARNHQPQRVAYRNDAV